MEKRIPIKTFYLLLVISLGLVGLGIGSTYAVFTASAEIDKPIVLSSNLTYSSDLIETVSINVPAGGAISSKLNVSNSTNDKLNYVVWYNSHGSDVEIGTSYGSPTGSLAAGGSTSVIVDVRNNENSNVTIVFGISSSVNSVILGSDMIIVPNKKLTLKGAALYITNLYMGASPTKITQSGSNKSYYYASSVGLMNDGLDSVGNSTNSVSSGNIRYYGANPNNYIYFNCSDYYNQNDGTCEKWRIIGVVDGKLKIVRDEAIGEYAFDYNASGNFNYNWHDAAIQTLLNGGYYNNSDGVTFYNYSTTASTINFNTDKIGINDKTREFISESIWYLGGSATMAWYPNQIYTYERGSERPSNSTYDLTWRGNVGIMYPSDYGFAADLSLCGKRMNAYNDASCTSNNWLYSGNYEWFITPNYQSDSTIRAMRLTNTGTLGSNETRLKRYIRPTVYLNSDVNIAEGDGTSESPYKIEVVSYDSKYVVSGIPPLTLANSKGADLIDYKIEGNSVQNGTPTPTTPIEIKSVGEKTINLFDKTTIDDNTRLNFGNLASNDDRYTSDYIDCINIDSVSINLAASFAWYDDDKNIVSYENKSVTMFRNYTKPDGARYLKLDFEKTVVSAEDIMIVSGSYTTNTMPNYEPYGYRIPVKVSNETEEIVTDIYLNEPLRKIGDYIDYIDFENSKIVRQINEIVLDGVTTNKKVSQVLEYTNNGLYYAVLPNLSGINGDKNVVLNTHFIPALGVLAGNSYVTNLGTYHVMVHTNQELNTVTLWNTWLEEQYNNGTPVTLYYALENEQEETIELPNIPTIKGRTVIEVLTEVQPSNIEISYYAE